MRLPNQTRKLASLGLLIMASCLRTNICSLDDARVRDIFQQTPVGGASEGLHWNSFKFP